MTKYMLVIMMRSFVQERRDARLFSNDGTWIPTSSSVLGCEIFSQTSESLSSNGFPQT
jgi:hypothetical protein